MSESGLVLYEGDDFALDHVLALIAGDGYHAAADCRDDLLHSVECLDIAHRLSCLNRRTCDRSLGGFRL